MKKFFALVKKPTDIYEVYSIIEFYKIKDITIFLLANTWTNYSNFKKYCLAKIKTKDTKIKITKIFLKDIPNINWPDKLKKFKIIAVPLNWHKVFYWNVNDIKSKRKKIILISDGIIDALDLIKYTLIKIDSFFRIYRLLSYFILKKRVSDECFFINYPLKTPHAKKTFPVSSNFLPDNKIINLLKKNKVNTFILGSRQKSKQINLNKLLKKNAIKNFCFYKRGSRKIIINGRIIKMNNILIAEEIINTNLIKSLYGTLSTSIFYAHYKKIKINLILTKFKPWLLYYFLKEKFNQINI